MFICLHCGHEFEEPSNRYNKRWSDSDDSEQYCPNCGSEDFEEAKKCELCDEWHSADRIVNGVCKDCIERGSKDIKSLLRYAIDAFTTEELDELIYNGMLLGESRRMALDNEDIFTEILKEEEK